MPYARIASDFLRCAACQSDVAHGDHYCRRCGHQFNPSDLEKMDRQLKSIRPSDWFRNYRVRPNALACPHCSARIEYIDICCRACGHRFTIEEKRSFPIVGAQNAKPQMLKYIAAWAAGLSLIVVVTELLK